MLHSRPKNDGSRAQCSSQSTSVYTHSTLLIAYLGLSQSYEGRIVKKNRNSKGKQATHTKILLYLSRVQCLLDLSYVTVQRKEMCGQVHTCQKSVILLHTRKSSLLKNNFSGTLQSKGKLTIYKTHIKCWGLKDMLGNFLERLLQVFPEERNKSFPNGYYFSVVCESMLSEEMVS